MIPVIAEQRSNPQAIGHNSLRQDDNRSTSLYSK